VTWDQVRAFRLARHGLLERQPATPASIVATVSQVCGIQAQVQSSAELQLWARLDGLNPRDVREALRTQRSLVRTWCMRGTLHLLAADELPYYVAALRTIDRWKGVWLRLVAQCSEAELRALLDAIAATLSDTPMTREQLAAAVADRVPPHARDRLLSGWAELLKPAAFAGALIQGPPDGQNVTFVRPDRWLSDYVEPSAADGWRHVVRSYLATYGPATREEFARWFGIQPAPAGRALKASADLLTEVTVEGQRASLLREDLETLVAARPSKTVHLLPGFDVFVLGPRPRAVLVDPEHEARVFRQAGWVSPVVLVNGRAAGVWTHTVERDGVRVRLELFEKDLRPAERRQVAAEVNRLGRFLDRPAQVTYSVA
jgi:hypothetical protein